MTTFKAICIQEYAVRDKEGSEWKSVRGREYIISEPKNGKVVCFSEYWVTVPVAIFAGLVPFTGEHKKLEIA